MVTIRNVSSKDRVLPSGSLIPPGASAGVEESVWKRDKRDAKVAAWLSKGLLVEGSESTGATELDEADILIAKLAKHGIVKTRRSSLESLTAALEKAEAAE